MSINNNIVEQLKRFKNIQNGDYVESERKAFTTVSGELLDIKSGLRKEYMKIDTMFTFDSGEDLVFIESNHIRSLIDALSIAIEDEYNYDFESLKRIIVLLDLYLGIEVSYYGSLLGLINNAMIEQGIEAIQYNDFEDIYNLVNIDGYRR